MYLVGPTRDNPVLNHLDNRQLAKHQQAFKGTQGFPETLVGIHLKS